MRVDIFLRPVTDEHVVYLYDPTVADSVVIPVEPVIIQEEHGGGHGNTRVNWFPSVAEIEQEDEEIMAIVAAFVRIQESVAA